MESIGTLCVRVSFGLDEFASSNAEGTQRGQLDKIPVYKRVSVLAFPFSCSVMTSIQIKQTSKITNQVLQVHHWQTTKPNTKSPDLAYLLRYYWWYLRKCPTLVALCSLFYQYWMFLSRWQGRQCWFSSGINSPGLEQFMEHAAIIYRPRAC